MNVKLTASNLIDKIMDYYRVSTFTELSNLINIGQPAITKWKKNNSINAIKKKCRELGIYNEIFSDSKISNKEEAEDKTTNDLSKYFIALQSVANATSKEDELIEDIKNLMKKYIGE
ncbi:hypothetical protein [Aliarcobacter skirrowii]|uniref:hypothetical protein n=1 Tax=Aliarcobacter skirrowii TaxID=28200 RepID=UPI0008367133|nr:hypothetical protein [Aliarcobacter skirrowii]